MIDFWQTLKKPIFILAPMEDVTDTVFRRIILGCGRPDIFFTEFTNVDGMMSIGNKQVSQRLAFTPEEKPIIAQIWGLQPENFFKAAQKLVAMGFDGIDINMGCPQRSVTSRGACSALIKNHSLAKEIIEATVQGSGNKIPVSVKTRLGYSSITIDDWIGFLLDQNLPALTIHGRTVVEMSSVPAHWDAIGEVVKLRDEKKVDTLIFGNGDIRSLKQANEMVEKYKVDGVMIGRGIFENPWMFDKDFDINNVTIKQRTDLLLKHIALFEKTWGKEKYFKILKKYFKIYIAGFPGAQDLRLKLMEANNGIEVEKILKTVL